MPFCNQGEATSFPVTIRSFIVIFLPGDSDLQQELQKLLSGMLNLRLCYRLGNMPRADARKKYALC